MLVRLLARKNKQIFCLDVHHQSRVINAHETCKLAKIVTAHIEPLLEPYLILFTFSGRLNELNYAGSRQPLAKARSFAKRLAVPRIFDANRGK